MTMLPKAKKTFNADIKPLTKKKKRSNKNVLVNQTKVYLAVFFGGLLSMSQVNATENHGSQSLTTVTAEAAEEQFSQAELEQMLAPIALYPDTLLTHILIAATYPIEVIDADRFIEQHKHLSAQKLSEKAEDKQWDPSVKALLPFPTILANLSKDLAWMRKLGDAFLQDESQVLVSIQSLRHKADEAGNLAQMDNVEIVREKRTIIIEPAQAEIVYVPYYDTRKVYGYWHWSHYPPVYWHRPAHYAYYHGPYYWHSGVHIAFDFFFSAFHWNNHHIVRYHHKKRYHHSNRRIATSHHAKRWHHDPSHRQGVAYRSNKVKHRYASHSPSTLHSKSVRKHHQAEVRKEFSSPASKREDKYRSQKYQQVNERLKVNRAVKINDKRHRDSLNHIATNKRETNSFEMNKTDRQKVRLHQVENKHSADNQHRTKVPQHRVYSHDSWKKQKSAKMADASEPRRSYQRSADTHVDSRKNTTAKVDYSKQESYKTQGGRSTKQYQRATKNSSGSSKPSSRHQREKHK